MLESQRLQIRMSEMREQINAYPDDGEVEGLAQLRAQHLEAELQFREAVKTEAEGQHQEPPMEGDAPEARELDALYHRSRLTRMVHAIYEGRALDGPEAEFRAALYPQGSARQAIDQVVPLHMFLPLDEEYEVRADSATSVSAATGHRTTRPIAQRIFARTDGAFLGATFVGVGGGTQRFPYVSAGASLSYADEGEEIDATAGAITVEDVDPQEASLAYLVGLSSMQRFGAGELEAALRADASMAIADGIDDTLIRGRSATAALTTAIPGIETSIANPAAAITTVTAQDILGAYASRVDGRYAYTWMDSRILTRHEVYGKAIFEAIGGATGERLLADLLGEGMFRASARLSAPSGGVSNAISYAPMMDRSEWLVPTWQDVMVIADPYTEARRRQVRLTFNLAHNVLLLRPEPWRKHSFKHT